MTASLIVSSGLAQQAAAVTPAVATEEPPVVTSHSERTASLVTPTALLTPAAAMPALRGRVLLGADAQTPSGSLDGVRPLVAAELGLGKGLTLGAGSRWVGGDTVTGTSGLAPYGQLRLQVFGDAQRHGAVGGVSLTYKQVGFRGGERELEAGFTTTYRSRWVEMGGQVVVGQSLREGEEHDGELRAYVAARVLPNLSLGLTGQVRTRLGEEDEAERAKEGGPEGREWDALGGVLASLYVSDVQVGLVGGVTTQALSSSVGAYGQAFVGYLF